MASDGQGFEYYAAGAGGKGLTVLPSNGEYDPGISEDINAQIRNMPMVKKHCDDMAQLLMVSASAGVEFGSELPYEVVKAGGESRYRAYVAPANTYGIEAELDHAQLLKAALGMRGR
jgi:hypothetical protein